MISFLPEGYNYILGIKESVCNRPEKCLLMNRKELCRKNCPRTSQRERHCGK
jgi:hypothetical protein